LGVLETAYAAGAILAILVFGQLHLTRRRGFWAYLALLSAVLSLFILWVPWNNTLAPLFSSTAMAIIGFGLSFFGVIWVTILQELVPVNKLGRVNSVDWLCSFGFTPLAFGIAGILTDTIGPGWLFFLGGIIGSFMVIGAFCVDDVRNLQ
jgi:MFS family permease